MYKATYLRKAQRNWRMQKGQITSCRNTAMSLLHPDFDSDHELVQCFENMFNILEKMNDGHFIDLGGKING